MRSLGCVLLVALVLACGSAGSPGPSGDPTPGPSPTPPTGPTSTPIATGGPSLIAYVIDGPGGQELRVVAPDGTGDRSCGPGSAPGWSADGTTLVFAGPPRSTADGYAFPDAYRASPTCADPALVIREATDPHLSPDGAWITFGRGVIDTGEAWIAKADGTGPRRLAAATSPAWSPDEQWLLMQPDGGAYELGLIRPDGSEQHSLARGTEPSWTPDGRIVYIHSNDPQPTVTIRVIALDGQGTEVLTLTGGEVAAPRMLRDGRVVFAWKGDVWRLDPGAQAPVRLTEGLEIMAGPSVSADGRSAAVAVGGVTPGLAVVSLDGGQVQLATGAVSAVAWQPVGGVP